MKIKTKGSNIIVTLGVREARTLMYAVYGEELSRDGDGEEPNPTCQQFIAAIEAATTPPTPPGTVPSIPLAIPEYQKKEIESRLDAELERTGLRGYEIESQTGTVRLIDIVKGPTHYQDVTGWVDPARLLDALAKLDDWTDDECRDISHLHDALSLPSAPWTKDGDDKEAEK